MPRQIKLSALKVSSEQWCKHCSGYGSSLKDPEGTNRCTACAGSGLAVNPPTCRWFALCDRAATGTTPHVILGDVPTCDRCHKFATGEDRV